MPAAILGGTGIYKLSGIEVEAKEMTNDYGTAQVFMGKGEYEDIVFLTRHGLDHSTPPHKVNYRANIQALKDLGVRRIMSTYAVGSITVDYPVLDLAVLRDFLDFTHGRAFTFFDDLERAVGHVEMSQPFCPVMTNKLMNLAAKHDIKCHDGATYVATNGPRFESPAEIKMYQILGGHVVGMTCCPEVYLAGELGMNFAAVALPINLAAGLEEKITLVEDNIDEVRQKMIKLMLDVLRNTSDDECTPPIML
ncbi:MAG: 5'-methylthioadenosine phosphorylase [Flavobacterium sp.]|jgi:5'-methylthioadenosine phosphorylase